MRTLFAVYDLGVSPSNHDSLPFMLMAEMERRSRGLDRMLAIIVTGKDRPFKSKPYGDLEQDWRITRIVVPAARMLGADVMVTRDREMVRALIAGQACFPVGYTVDAPLADYRPGRYMRAVRAGQDVPEFVPHRRAVAMVAEAFPEPFVTITMRRTTTTSKNSDRAAWRRLIERHRDRIQFVVIPEAADVLVDTDYHPARTFAPACLDADIRLALYRRAVLNMGVSNGCMVWAVHGDAPFLKFNCGDGNAKVTAYLTENGWGPDLPRWPRQYGRFVWKPDSIEVIEEHFLESMKELGR